jgi:hypothetical protein
MLPCLFPHASVLRRVSLGLVLCSVAGCGNGSSERASAGAAGAALAGETGTGGVEVPGSGGEAGTAEENQGGSAAGGTTWSGDTSSCSAEAAACEADTACTVLAACLGGCPVSASAARDACINDCYYASRSAADTFLSMCDCAYADSLGSCQVPYQVACPSMLDAVDTCVSVPPGGTCTVNGSSIAPTVGCPPGYSTYCAGATGNVYFYAEDPSSSDVTSLATVLCDGGAHGLVDLAGPVDNVDVERYCDTYAATLPSGTASVHCSATPSGKVDIYLVVGRPMSMMMSTQNATSTVWADIRAGLDAFVAEAQTAGWDVRLGVELFGASGTSDDRGECAPDSYAPSVELAAADSAGPDILSVLDSSSPAGLSPTFPALRAALEYAKAWTRRSADATTPTVVLLLTDGIPTQCTCSMDSIEVLADIAAFGFEANPSVRTFVLEIDALRTSTTSVLDAVAAAGGTRAARVTGGDAIPSGVLSALQAILADPGGCEW